MGASSPAPIIYWLRQVQDPATRWFDFGCQGLLCDPEFAVLEGKILAALEKIAQEDLRQKSGVGAGLV